MQQRHINLLLDVTEIIFMYGEAMPAIYKLFRKTRIINEFYNQDARHFKHGRATSLSCTNSRGNSLEV